MNSTTAPSGIGDYASDCAVLAHFISQSGLLDAQRLLLLQDYAGRSGALDDPILYGRFDRSFIRAFSPRTERQSDVPVQNQQAHGSVDVGVLVVTRTELDSALVAFDVDPEDFVEGAGSRRFFEFSLQSRRTGGALKVALTNIGVPTNARVGPAFSQMFYRYRPQIMLLVGIAAGDKKRCELGDVFAPDKVIYLEPERDSEEGPLPRPEPLPIPPQIQQNLTYFRPSLHDLRMRVGELVKSKRVGRPKGYRMNREFKVDFDGVTLVSSERLVDDPSFFHQLQQTRDQRIRLVDMESFGFGENASRLEVDWAIFRGISDYGDGAKNDEWQRVAAVTAALAAREFLEACYIPRNLGL